MQYRYISSQYMGYVYPRGIQPIPVSAMNQIRIEITWGKH